MKFEDFKLSHGYPLQLQTNSGGQPERFSCRLIGCIPGRSIILSVPRAAGRMVRFRPGQKMVVRLMVDNGIGIFAATVDAQTNEPYPLLHVSYPETVSFKGIRGARRVAVELPLFATNPGVPDLQDVPGKFVDISSSGARMELDKPIGEVGDKLVLRANVSILGIIRDMAINAIIRSRVERSVQDASDPMPAVYGVEFTEQDEDRRLLLYAYVFSQIARDDYLP